MTIKFEKRRDIVNFGNVEIGDVFYYNDDIFIKIEDATGKSTNIVNLYTGIATYPLSNNDTVERLNCELIVKN